MKIGMDGVRVGRIYTIILAHNGMHAYPDIGRDLQGAGAKAIVWSGAYSLTRRS